MNISVVIFNLVLFLLHEEHGARTYVILYDLRFPLDES